jgi:hypothetical protein
MHRDAIYVIRFYEDDHKGLAESINYAQQKLVLKILI